MRLFKITACIPCPEKVRTQRELQNTYFTKWVPYSSWFAEQQRIMKLWSEELSCRSFADGDPWRAQP